MIWIKKKEVNKMDSEHYDNDSDFAFTNGEYNNEVDYEGN